MTWLDGFVAGAYVMGWFLVVTDHLIIPWVARRTVRARSPHDRR